MPKSPRHPMDVLKPLFPSWRLMTPIRMTSRETPILRRPTPPHCKLPSIVAAWDRIRKGSEPVRPSPELTHAGNFLYMLSGSLPDRATARDFDICLILHAEHSFNASTFAGREVASTHAHLMLRSWPPSEPFPERFMAGE